MTAIHPLTVCYMGITEPTFSRTNVYIKALRKEGIHVLECFDTTPGLKKFFRIFKKHAELTEPYDVVIVGCASAILVPFVKLITRTPVIFDAGWSLYEGTVISRGKHRNNPFKRLRVWSIDWISYLSADLVLLETNAQIRFYTSLVRGKASACRRLFTGVDESGVAPDTSILKRNAFTVVFRGYANPEAGLACIVEAARLLEGEGIQFLIISPNWLIPKDLPQNIETRIGFFASTELWRSMCECHAAFGQVERHERLERTIPHKAYEAMALGLPYLTADSVAIRELFNDRRNCLMVQAGNAADLAEKIRLLAQDSGLASRIVLGAKETYQKECSNAVLARELIAYIDELTGRPVFAFPQASDYNPKNT
ncbi:MAG: glycosyltransferase [Minisyncoccia bacterium]